MKLSTPVSSPADAAARKTGFKLSQALSALRRYSGSYGMVLPALVLYALFVIYPLIRGIIISFHQWDGLSGKTPDRRYIVSEPGQFTGWELGVTFSVPLGLRQGRAAVRQWQLLIQRDRANLEQALHNTTHTLATSYRNLAEFYEQYRAFREAREAAHANLDVQLKAYEVGRTIYLNVLQAITDWGNAVSAEARSLIEYNVELANLEQQTGIILEAHGVRFIEERFAAIGPLGPATSPRCYPHAMRPGANVGRYPGGEQPAETTFELDSPVAPSAKSGQEMIPTPPPRG